MKCEACLPLVDEFFDGELDARHAGDVRAHMKLCASCSGYYESLRMGQDVFDKFLEDVKLSPAAWQGVRRRIQEKEVAREGFFEKLNWLAIPRFEWAVVAAALGTVILAMVVIRFATSASDKRQVAVVNPDRVASPHPSAPASVPQSASEQPRFENEQSNLTSARVANKHLGRSVRPRPPQLDTLPAPTLNPDPVAAMFESAAAFNKELQTARVELEASRPVTLETDVARHFEKTRLLLLSLKNTSISDTDASVNVSYEKTVSRKLAGSNLLLRRETAAAGDRSAAELLEQIEPLLIDIANMPDRASAEEVAAMSRRIVRKDVIGLLQSQTF